MESCINLEDSPVWGDHHGNISTHKLQSCLSSFNEKTTMFICFLHMPLGQRYII